MITNLLKIHLPTTALATPPSRSFSLVCASALLLFAAPIAVHGQFNYIANNGAITITGYIGLGGAVNIPAQINGLPVTGIGDDAFEARFNITAVTVPNSVISIGPCAFYYIVNLTNFMIGDGVTAIEKHG